MFLGNRYQFISILQTYNMDHETAANALQAMRQSVAALEQLNRQPQRINPRRRQHNQRRPRRPPRRWQIRPIWRDRTTFGAHYSLRPRLDVDDHMFFRYYRMNPVQFAALLLLLEPHLAGYGSNRRTSIPPNEQLSVCLRLVYTNYN